MYFNLCCYCYYVAIKRLMRQGPDMEGPLTRQANSTWDCWDWHAYRVLHTSTRYYGLKNSIVNYADGSWSVTSDGSINHHENKLRTVEPLQTDCQSCHLTWRHTQGYIHTLYIMRHAYCLPHLPDNYVQNTLGLDYVFCTNTWLMRIYTPGGARTAEQGLAGSVSLQSGPGKAFHRLALTGSAFSTLRLSWGMLSRQLGRSM